MLVARARLCPACQEAAPRRQLDALAAARKEAAAFARAALKSLAHCPIAGRDTFSRAAK
jgi:hypothetical protein